MTIRNRLAKSEDPVMDRSAWTLAEHCEYANAQMHLKGLHEYRRKTGLPPAHWVVRNGRVVMELKDDAATLLSNVRRDVMDRRGEPMTRADTDKLNGILASLGATKRYRPDGSKYDAPIETAD